AKFIGEQPDFREVIPNGDKVLQRFLPKLDGDQLTLIVDEPALASLVEPYAEYVRKALLASAANNMKLLAIGMHNSAANSRTGAELPAVANFDKQGKPLLSWRVHLVRYMGEKPLYKELKLDEPWDSEHNKKLIAKMPIVFANPYNPMLAADGKTTYLAPVHKDAVFTGEVKS